MAAQRFRIVVAAAVIAVWSCAHAASSAPPACEVPAPEAHPLADRRGVLAEYERLPRPCLEQIVLQCSAAAGESFLDQGSAAICSIGYEALLKSGFNGNFNVMLSWWRSQKQAEALN